MHGPTVGQWLWHIRNIVTGASWPGNRKTKKAKVGVMTCAYNEVACSAFAIGALLNLVDLYVFVDTGSNDGTVELIEDLYPTAILEGHLIVKRLGKLPDYDIAIARNVALEIFKSHEIERFLKIDADVIFYDNGAQRLVQTARRFPTHLTTFYCREFELGQWEILDSLEWLTAIRDNRNVFWEMPLPPPQDRVYTVDGARANGKWTDEVASQAEGICYSEKVSRVGTLAVLSAHYGWARPLKKKQEKAKVWFGANVHDPRVNGFPKDQNWTKTCRPFNKHPEIFARKVDDVLEWLKTKK